MPRRIILTSVVLLSALLANSLTAKGALRPTLNKKLTEALTNTVIPAYRQGNPLATLKGLSPFVARLTDEQVEALNILLAENDLPPLGYLLVESRMAMVHQNLTRDLPRASMREVLLALPALEAQIKATLASKETHPAMTDPLPKPKEFSDYEKLFWEIYVLDQRLDTAARLSRYGQQLIQKSPRSKRRSLDDVQKAILETDFAAYLSSLETLHRDLRERAIELRIERLDLAEEVIETSKDIKRRFMAAYVADLDGELLVKFFKEAQPKGDNDPERFTRQRLKQPGLPEEISIKADSVRQSAGDLVLKSRLFHTGLQWWLRGRYGQGFERGGLLKSRQALRSPQAQLALYMPNVIPKPTDPYELSSYPVPQIDRRHHEIWKYEYRQITSSSSRSKSTQIQSVNLYPNPTLTQRSYCRGLHGGQRQVILKGVTNSKTTTTVQLTRRVTPEDVQMVTRLVGYLEYGNALRNFDALVKMSSQEELKVINSLIKERDEFAIYTNLSRRNQPQPSSLSEVGGRTNDNFERRGLGWVMALARIELGSMLAGFTSVKEPFAAVGPTEYEMPQYRELLLDGTRSHYWAIQNDPNLARVSQSRPGTTMLSYVRRLILARAMMRAAAQAGADQFSQAQMQELISWKSDLDDLQSGFFAIINNYLGRHQRSNATFSSEEILEEVPALLRAEQRELAAGTARVVEQKDHKD